MPERTATQTAFIWYHADEVLSETLQTWVDQTGRLLGIPSKLMLRRQPEKTTFMEIYELAGDSKAMLETIEANAAQQPWFAQLHSPRRAEVFFGIQ
jgi:hypothetical protein